MNSVILLVLDGFGIAAPGPGNAIHLAHPQTFISLMHSYPNGELEASGSAVGLPPGEVGSTEVGHINMGAGHVVYQNLPRINLAIDDGSFFTNLSFLKSVDHLKNTSGDMHLVGLVGSGSVHASIEHLYALLEFCKRNNLKKVFIHAICDGRDSPPKDAIKILSDIENKIAEKQVGKVASVIGRFFALDRDRRWHRVEKAYHCLTKGTGRHSPSWRDAIEASYNQNKTDEFIEPTNIVDPTGNPIGLIKEGDSVIFFNYRIDRPRELTKAFVLEEFEKQANYTSYDPYATKYYKKHLKDEEVLEPVFTRGPKIPNLFFVTMTEYERNLPVDVAYPPHVISMPLGRVISEQGLSQLRIAESEKERFIGFYFNGLRETPFADEERIIIPSPKVHSYAEKPEMSAYEITEILIKKMFESKYHFFLVNFANPDMVGHTGELEASVKAVQVVDQCLAKITKTALETNHSVLITADHGNVEEKIDLKSGLPRTEHTSNPVPFIVVNKALQGKNIKLPRGALSDIAPTILHLLQLPKPSQMTGRDLLGNMGV